jgi:hypothetical protein
MSMTILGRPPLLLVPPPPPLLSLLAGCCAVAQLVSIPTASATPPANPTFLISRAGRLKSSTYSHLEDFGSVFILISFFVNVHLLSILRCSGYSFINQTDAPHG